MMSLKVVYIGVFWLFTFVSKSNAACGTCGQNRVACTSDRAYTMCPDGKTLTTQYGECLSGQVCVDSPTDICVPKTTTVVLGCDKIACNVCSGIFMCKTKYRFAYCDSTGNALPNATGNCPTGQICNVEQFKSSSTICVPECGSTITPTCSNTDIIPVTPTPPDITTACAGITTNGIYAVKGSCTDYVLCETNNGVMTAVLGSCSPRYWDQTLQTCTDRKPTTC